MAIGSVVVTGCVADNEHIAESTGSTSQVWSTNSVTQPLTISCGLLAPYQGAFLRGPGAIWVPVNRFFSPVRHLSPLASDPVSDLVSLRALQALGGSDTAVLPLSREVSVPKGAGGVK